MLFEGTSTAFDPVSQGGAFAVKLAPRTMSLKKHLEGWQLAVVSLTIAGGTAVVVVPRPVRPDSLPVPFIEPREATEIARADQVLSNAALTERLDGHVRRLGSAVRGYGRAESAHDEAEQRNAKLAIDTALPKTPSAEQVLRLRAFQTTAFLAALRRWEATGEISTDLVELGGSFTELASDNGWISEGERFRTLSLDDTARRAMFKKRWNELVGLTDPAFALTRVESEALAGFLLVHPAIPASARGARTMTAALADQQRLKKVVELEKLDPSYPALVARGIVAYRIGAFPEAAESFAQYAEAHSSGPYRLRAINHLRASLDASALGDED